MSRNAVLNEVSAMVYFIPENFYYKTYKGQCHFLKILLKKTITDALQS